MRKFVYPEMKITVVDEESFLLTTSGMDCYEDDCDDDYCDDERSDYY